MNFVLKSQASEVSRPSPDVSPGFLPMTLRICKAEGQVQLLRELLKRNACCAQREPISGCTALHLAARNGEEVPFGSIWQLNVEVKHSKLQKVMLCIVDDMFILQSWTCYKVPPGIFFGTIPLTLSP